MGATHDLFVSPCLDPSPIARLGSMYPQLLGYGQLTGSAFSTRLAGKDGIEPSTFAQELPPHNALPTELPPRSPYRLSG